jgi:hypothetical protein
MDKASPDSVAIRVYEEIAKGSEDIYPDPFAVQFAADVQADFKAAEKANAAGF